MNQPTISLESRLRPSKDVLARELEGDLVFLQLESEIYFGLDDIGARVWQALCDSGNIGDAIDALHEEFDVERDVLEKDVLELATALVAKNLLVAE